MFLKAFYEKQNIVLTMHLTMLIAHNKEGTYFFRSTEVNNYDSVSPFVINIYSACLERK